MRLDVSGRENVPAGGPLVVCSNHIAWLDPVVLGVVLPRRIAFMAKEELFRYPVFGWCLRLLGAFPVKRGTADRNAVHFAGRVLSRGGVVGMFPEGTRSRTGQLGKAHNGAAYLAVRNRARVVPVGIRGPYGFARRIAVAIGPAMSLGEEGSKRITSKDMDEAAGRIMEAIASLVKRESPIAG
jgi:1-acyl-sn-glycerol-3-phosphate acyltransferase